MSQSAIQEQTRGNKRPIKKKKIIISQWVGYIKMLIFIKPTRVRESKNSEVVRVFHLTFIAN